MTRSWSWPAHAWLAPRYATGPQQYCWASAQAGLQACPSRSHRSGAPARPPAVGAGARGARGTSPAEDAGRGLLPAVSTLCSRSSACSRWPACTRLMPACLLAAASSPMPPLPAPPLGLQRVPGPAGPAGRPAPRPRREPCPRRPHGGSHRVRAGAGASGRRAPACGGQAGPGAPGGDSGGAPGCLSQLSWAVRQARPLRRVCAGRRRCLSRRVCVRVPCDWNRPLAARLLRPIVHVPLQPVSLLPCLPALECTLHVPPPPPTSPAAQAARRWPGSAQAGAPSLLALTAAM